jgi:hypothetical protein
LIDIDQFHRIGIDLECLVKGQNSFVIIAGTYFIISCH